MNTNIDKVRDIILYQIFIGNISQNNEPNESLLKYTSRITDEDYFAILCEIRTKVNYYSQYIIELKEQFDVRSQLCREIDGLENSDVENKIILQKLLDKCNIRILNASYMCTEITGLFRFFKNKSSYNGKYFTKQFFGLEARIRTFKTYFKTECEIRRIYNNMIIFNNFTSSI